MPNYVKYLGKPSIPEGSNDVPGFSGIFPGQIPEKTWLQHTVQIARYEPIEASLRIVKYFGRCSDRARFAGVA